MTGEYTLVSAAGWGDYEAVKYLIEAGNDVNYYSKEIGSPLRNAIWYGFLDIVDLLAENGADVNHVDDFFGSMLGMAARTSANITQCLIDHGADVNIQSNNGVTPLMEAVYAKRADCVKILLDAGADVSIEDNAGRTAKSLAGKNKEMLELLS